MRGNFRGKSSHAGNGRTFGHEFGDAERRFAALAPEKTQNSDEVYLLTLGSDANVKIRDNVLDIKQLERVNEDGLEQWRPLLKEPFPIAIAIVARSARAGTAAIAIDGDALSLNAFLAGVESAAAGVRAVFVSKRRTRYHVHGCVAELTDLVADGKTVRTTAIEDADPAKVMSAVRAMGLDDYANVNYPRGLKQLVGMSA